MTVRERAIRALEAWVRAYQPLPGTYGEVLHDEVLVDAVAAEFGWRPIETLPEDDRLVLAKTADGRRMLWPTALLRGNLKRAAAGREPEHLKFPAVAWTEIPE